MTKDKLEFIRENAPCYLYDKEMIDDRCTQLQNKIPCVQFLYSVKTNPFAPVLQTIASHGFGADAASANEVLRAVQAGIASDLIYYSAPGKTEQDIEKVWGKCTIIADSFSELEMLETLAARKNSAVCVGVRVNPAFSMDGGKTAASKFGIDEDQLSDVKPDYPHLTITGIHVHLRSQILDADVLCKYYTNCYEMAERFSRHFGTEIAYINFGSGIGTVYDNAMETPLALEKIGNTMEQLRMRSQSGLKARLILETGRFLVCNAGTYYTKIADRKRSCGKTFLIVQNALNGFLRPAIAELLRQNLGAFPANGQEPLYTSASQCSFEILGKSGAEEVVDVAGNLCTALDVMARDIRLPHGEIGDILQVTNAGSYAYSLTPLLFSSQDAPKEYLWRE